VTATEATVRQARATGQPIGGIERGTSGEAATVTLREFAVRVKPDRLFAQPLHRLEALISLA
jgi:hypothetical protein